MMTWMRSFDKVNNDLLSIRSQDINKITLKWIPIVPLDRIWDGRQVQEFLKL